MPDDSKLVVIIFMLDSGFLPNIYYNIIEASVSAVTITSLNYLFLLLVDQ